MLDHHQLPWWHRCAAHYAVCEAPCRALVMDGNKEYEASTGFVYSKVEVWLRTRAALGTSDEAVAAGMPCVKEVAVFYQAARPTGSRAAWSVPAGIATRDEPFAVFLRWARWITTACPGRGKLGRPRLAAQSLANVPEPHDIVCAFLDAAAGLVSAALDAQMGGGARADAGGVASLAQGDDGAGPSRPSSIAAATPLQPFQVQPQPIEPAQAPNPPARAGGAAPEPQAPQHGRCALARRPPDRGR